MPPSLNRVKKKNFFFRNRRKGEYKEHCDFIIIKPIMTSSSSINTTLYEKILSFVNFYIKSLNIGPAGI